MKAITVEPKKPGTEKLLWVYAEQMLKLLKGNTAGPHVSLLFKQPIIF